MDDEVARDMDRAMHAVAATWRQWASRLIGAVKLHRVEGDAHPLLQALDRMGFTDYIGQTDAGFIKIAMRTQFPPHAYRSHTVRTDRWTGVPTEWPKLREAFGNEDSAELPTWTVQIYVSNDGLTFTGGGAIRTRQFVEWLIENEAQLPRRTSPQEFMIAWWAWLRRDLIEVRTLGEDKLRPPSSVRSGPFEYFNKKILFGPCPECGMATAVGFKGERITSAPARCCECRAQVLRTAIAQNVTGPCARCQEPCTRYGKQGGPLCDSCRK